MEMKKKQREKMDMESLEEEVNKPIGESRKIIYLRL